MSESEAVVRRLHAVAELPPWAPQSVVTRWELSRRGNGLAPDDEAEALAQLDHPEFYLLWDREDDLPDRFQVGQVNPRLHVLLHQVVESQLIKDEPPAARVAVAHLLELGVGRHEALHLLMEGLLRQVGAAGATGVQPGSDYLAHLESLSRCRLGSAIPPGAKPGRNDPCPCGSGKKFKRCCGGVDAPPPVEQRGARMVLGAGFYATPQHLAHVGQGDPLLYLQNLSAVAQALERERADNLAAEGYRRLVAAAAAIDENALSNALHDQQEFALNHPEYMADGVAATNRLIERAVSPGEVAALRLDLADLYDGAGETERADALFQEVMATDPPDPYAHLRWARRLADAGRGEAEAAAVYRRVIERQGMGDREALDAAKLELAELSSPPARS